MIRSLIDDNPWPELEQVLEHFCVKHSLCPEKLWRTDSSVNNLNLRCQGAMFYLIMSLSRGYLHKNEGDQFHSVKEMALMFEKEDYFSNVRKYFLTDLCGQAVMKNPVMNGRLTEEFRAEFIYQNRTVSIHELFLRCQKEVCRQK